MRSGQVSTIALICVISCSGEIVSTANGAEAAPPTIGATQPSALDLQRCALKDDVSSCTAIITGGHLTKIDLATAFSHRGVGYGKLRQFDRAIADFSQAIRLYPGLPDPDNMYFYTLLDCGVTYQTIGQHANAIKDFDQAIHMHPENAGAYLVRGLSYKALGQHDQAAVDFAKCNELKPGCIKNGLTP